ncbi:MAG: UbiX family flavin prenyltransferase [Euryarchaeota archaeon]|nr:UbiX family flavin prenyltransferase [Euryarchaeota archaeon]
MIIVAITGASGIIYGLKLLEVLKQTKKDTSLLITDPAKIILKHELNMNINELKNLASKFYHVDDLEASINSGSCRFTSMVIVPCTMKTLTAIANGYANNTITRAADVAIKERRKLVLVPRETPLRTVHIENMLRISREGGIILPAMPAFYHNPKKIDDIANFIVGKILDVLDIDHNLFKRWHGEIP